MAQQKRLEVAAIILAAGKGKRLNSTDVNKVSLTFSGKPMIKYGVELMEKVADHVVVVVGAFADSVKSALKNHPEVLYAAQTEQLGTGHATGVGLNAVKQFSPSLILLGFGDHLMFYKPETIRNLIAKHIERKAAVTFATTHYDKPEELAWSHIIRGEAGRVINIVEHKDATDEEKKITEINPGFYCFDYEFLQNNLKKIEMSTVTSEYYITDLFRIAWDQHVTIIAVPVPFEEVGIGVNRPEELQRSQKLFKDLHKN